jgi:hypothetical protein
MHVSLQASETCSSAYQLARLWKRPPHAKLLLRPPAAYIGAKHIGLFQNSIQYAAALEAAAHAAHEQQVPGDVQCFLQDVLASHAVATLAQLLAWLLPRPELLQLPALAADESAYSGCHSHGALWLACSRGGRRAVTHATTACSGWGERLARCEVARQHYMHPHVCLNRRDSVDAMLLLSC